MRYRVPGTDVVFRGSNVRLRTEAARLGGTTVVALELVALPLAVPQDVGRLVVMGPVANDPVVRRVAAPEWGRREDNYPPGEGARPLGVVPVHHVLPDRVVGGAGQRNPGAGDRRAAPRVGTPAHVPEDVVSLDRPIMDAAGRSGVDQAHAEAVAHRLVVDGAGVGGIAQEEAELAVLLRDVVPEHRLGVWRVADVEAGHLALDRDVVEELRPP